MKFTLTLVGGVIIGWTLRSNESMSIEEAHLQMSKAVKTTWSFASRRLNK